MGSVTPGEILEMAIRMEQRGHEFYERAAASVTHPGAAKLLAELAGDEVDHENLFLGIQQRRDYASLVRAEAPQDLALAQYLVADPIGPESTPQDVMVVAIKMEQAAIDLYEVWQRMYAGTELEPIIAGLVQEEMRHRERLEKAYEDMFMRDW